MKPKLFKQTKKEMQTAKILQEFLDSQWTQEDHEAQKRFMKILEAERLTNPYGLSIIKWDKSK